MTIVFYRWRFPAGEKGEKPGHYIPGDSGSLRRRRTEQRRIIYAPRGRVHKAQIF